VLLPVGPGSPFAGLRFLSGGQSGELACARSDCDESSVSRPKMPWPLTFSFARAIQHPALDIWSGHDATVKAAQKALVHRAQLQPECLPW